MREPARKLLVCAGEFYTDLIFFGLDRAPRLGEEFKTDNLVVSPGGGAGITAAAASLLGRPTSLATVFGRCLIHPDPKEHLQAAGVATRLSRTVDEGFSGLTVAISTREDRYFVTHPGVNTRVEEYLLRPDTVHRLTTADHVHFALTPSRWQAFCAAVDDLARAGTTVSWDLGWDPATGESGGFRHLCHTLDVLFLNEMEARRYAGTSSTDSALKHFARPNNIVVVKQGASGAVASQGGDTAVHATAIDITAVETTGAGDAFNGGFLHAWMDGMPLKQALIAGNVCGGLSTRSPGGWDGLPTRDEFDLEVSRIALGKAAGAKRA